MKKLIMSILSVGCICLLSGCTNDASVVSHNLSKAANQFEVMRRIVFYNGITGEYMLTVEGLCSLEPTDKKLMVTCKTGPSAYKKHYLGLSDNVTYFAEQMEPVAASPYHYRVVFKPAAILPDIQIAR
jgi:hypothetical protein